MNNAEKRIVKRLARDTAKLISINEKQLKPIMRIMATLLDDLLWQNLCKHCGELLKERDTSYSWSVHRREFVAETIIELTDRSFDAVWVVETMAGWNSELHEVE
jgi:hypothetical protein